MILVSHPTGNTFVRALLQGLEQRNKLDSFHTTIAGLPVGPLTGWLNQKLSRRSFPVPADKIQRAPLLETVRLLAPRLGLQALTTHETGWASTDAVYKNLDHMVADRLARRQRQQQNLPSGIYSYEDCCAATFAKAKQLGLTCFYELPIAYFETSQSLLSQESQRWPDWQFTLGATSDSAEKSQRKAREIELSDVIICPSNFVLDTLPAHIKKNKICLVSEFGSPGLSQVPEIPPARDRNGPLRVLFAGSLTQRKGLADLFQAIKLLDRTDVELVVMGSPVAPMSFYRSQLTTFTYEPPRSQIEVFKLMQSCDVLALPSIVEGRALVQQEAMSCGLPLLVTANAGGADLIIEGETGFLVPIRSPESLADKIEWFADHRQQTYAMGQNAAKKAASLTWDSYTSRILKIVLADRPD